MFLADSCLPGISGDGLDAVSRVLFEDEADITV